MRLFNVNPRTFIAIGHDIVVAALVWTFTFCLRWNFELDRQTQIILFQTLPVALAVQVGCFVYFGLYQGIWRYASIHDMRLIALSVGTSGIIIPILLLLLRNGLGIPRSIYFLDPLLLILFMCTGRLLYRWWKEKAMGAKGVEPQPVILLGAGNTALSLIDDLNRNPYWYVIGVLDDNPNKVGRQLGGVRILGNWEQLEQIARDSNCKHAVLAVGATNHATRRRVFEMCERAHIKLLVIPDVQELMSGQVKVSQIRYVDVDDLLGRDPVSLDTGGLRHMIEGKSVLVTGGGGSIGSELCRQIARFKPGELIIFELSEFALYRITEDLKRTFPQQKVVPVVGDIKDRARLEEIFEHHRPAIVYHAAAYKHVPILEENNAWQAVRNNALGTRVLADVAARFDIERFVYISSDKAVNPTNVMGATKRLAEMILQYQHSMATLPMVLVRFGNVLGSSGSVIPKFREQIANGGPVTVTHPDITRYFMSIPEATQLVLQAGLMGRGGETFVLDMGQPIRIVDLARTMVRLSGYTEAEIPIAFTGLRPGEKLFEELLADNEKTLPTPHPKLRVSRPIDPPGTSWDASVRRWLESSGPVGDAEVRQMLGLWVPEYRPAPLQGPVPMTSAAAAKPAAGGPGSPGTGTPGTGAPGAGLAATGIPAAGMPATAGVSTVTGAPAGTGVPAGMGMTAAAGLPAGAGMATTVASGRTGLPAQTAAGATTSTAGVIAPASSIPGVVTATFPAAAVSAAGAQTPTPLTPAAAAQQTATSAPGATSTTGAAPASAAVQTPAGTPASAATSAAAPAAPVSTATPADTASGAAATSVQAAEIVAEVKAADSIQTAAENAGAATGMVNGATVPSSTTASPSATVSLSPAGPDNEALLARLKELARLATQEPSADGIAAAGDATSAAGTGDTTSTGATTATAGATTGTTGTTGTADVGATAGDTAAGGLTATGDTGVAEHGVTGTHEADAGASAQNLDADDSDTDADGDTDEAGTETAIDAPADTAGAPVPARAGKGRRGRRRRH